MCPVDAGAVSAMLTLTSTMFISTYSGCNTGAPGRLQGAAQLAEHVWRWLFTLPCITQDAHPDVNDVYINLCRLRHRSARPPPRHSAVSRSIRGVGYSP